jgi:uncharacterized protein with ATP-grasp and redox domains
MVDERIALFGVIASVRRMDLQILRSKALSRLGEVASKIWDLDRAERWAAVAADNLRSYVRDSDPHKYWKKAASAASDTMAAIIERTESEEHKAALYKKRRG